MNAIPHTFTIDVDGVLQEERIGDAAIEGKLKKLWHKPGKHSRERGAPNSYAPEAFRKVEFRFATLPGAHSG